MTNKVKPFFIRITDDMTPQMVQDAFDKCVDGGAVADECIAWTSRKHSYQDAYDVNFNYFGVDDYNITVLYDNYKNYGIDAQEITLDQLDEWLGLESKKPESGQDVYIAQINTLAGVEEQRYFIHQYWCDSGHQNQLLELGILFTDKDDAITKTKSLLGIPHETPEQKAEREKKEEAEEMIQCLLGNYTECDDSAVEYVIDYLTECESLGK